MRPDPVLSMLGISQKAGSVKSGEFMTEKAVKEGKAFLCIVAGDASENTKKHFSDMCSYRNVPYIEYSDMESIGHAIGKQFRRRRLRRRRRNGPYRPGRHRAINALPGEPR